MGVLQEISQRWNATEDRLLKTNNLENIDLGKVGIRAYFLMIAGVWAGNHPAIAIPTVLVGLGAMGEATRLMEKRQKQNGYTKQS